jgi:hypothetical protein
MQGITGDILDLTKQQPSTLPCIYVFFVERASISGCPAFEVATRQHLPGLHPESRRPSSQLVNLTGMKIRIPAAYYSPGPSVDRTESRRCLKVAAEAVSCPPSKVGLCYRSHIAMSEVRTTRGRGIGCGY